MFGPDPDPTSTSGSGSETLSQTIIEIRNYSDLPCPSFRVMACYYDIQVNDITNDCICKPRALHTGPQHYLMFVGVLGVLLAVGVPPLNRLH